MPPDVIRPSRHQGERVVVHQLARGPDFCIAVAGQVSDVSTQSASMRQLVFAHSMVAYLFNTAVIALRVNIAASLAS